MTQIKHHVLGETQRSVFKIQRSSFPVTTHLQYEVALTNAVDFSLLAEHGLPRGGRHQTQTFLRKRERNKTEIKPGFYNPKEVNVFYLLPAKGRSVHLQIDGLSHLLQQAVVDDAVSRFLPDDGVCQLLPDVFPQKLGLPDYQHGRL